ncbi:MAG: methyltransferase domain-containing protein [Verrucomicrobia bacterium]|nr:methyltransferase domain-containing protein [Verrucomicrobiota bacterium]MBT7911582.1 methyltransferase domain-containing protein [Verrucomicrobiota bacterium]
MQINEDRDWEALYQANDTFWDHGEASPGLVDYLAANSSLPLGQALVPGCGRGHDARALAQAGWAATGLDLAPSSVPLAKRLADEERLPIDYRIGDFLSDEPHKLFDLVFEHTLFCAIPPVRRDDYVQALRRWLKPGGLYLAVNYMITEDNGEPPFSTTTAELDERFGEPFELLRRWTPRSYEGREGKELINEWRFR